MRSAAEELDDIDRIHDDAPAEAADRLRALDAAQMPADRLALVAFLFNHVLGEKLGDWAGAARHLDALRSRKDAPLTVTAHAAVADHLAGRRDSAARAALASASSPAVADVAIALRCLSFTQQPVPAAQFAETLRKLAAQAGTFVEPTALDAQLAAGLNNATSSLLDFDPDPADAVVREALADGAAQALRLWQRAGDWVNHERALYLVALAANRIGDCARARDAARQALAIIAAHGEEEVDRAFVLLQLAGALDRLGDSTGSSDAQRQAQAIADSWSEASLCDWFAAEHRRLFCR